MSIYKVKLELSFETFVEADDADEALDIADEVIADEITSNIEVEKVTTCQINGKCNFEGSCSECIRNA